MAILTRRLRADRESTVSLLRSLGVGATVVFLPELNGHEFTKGLVFIEVKSSQDVVVVVHNDLWPRAEGNYATWRGSMQQLVDGISGLHWQHGHRALINFVFTASTTRFAFLHDALGFVQFSEADGVLNPRKAKLTRALDPARKSAGTRTTSGPTDLQPLLF